MTVVLARLDKAATGPVQHLELAPGQADFVGRIADMTAWDNPNEDFHVILRGAEVVGFFKLDRGYPEGHPFARPGELGVRGVLVDRRLQGQGIGTAAMAALPAYVRGIYPQATALVLTVNCNNAAARRIYEKAGFRCEADLYLGGRSGPQHILRMPLVSSPEPA